MGVTPSFRRCPVTARPRPRPQAGTPRPAALPSARRAPLAFPAGTPSPLFSYRTQTRARPHSAARARHPPSPTLRPALQGFLGTQRRGVPADEERPGTARWGRDCWEDTPAGSLRPRTHLSSSAGALAALRGVSSAAGQGHAPDVSTQVTHGWVPAEVGGIGRRTQAELGPEVIPRPGSGRLSRTRQPTRLPRLLRAPRIFLGWLYLQ